jgi:acetylornithine deacetylase/succinyl-diaminopimelate desuccinylase-like protein
VFGPHRGITLANVFVAEGNIPTVVCGPRGGLHHTAAEYLELASLEPVARTHAQTACLFLAG